MNAIEILQERLKEKVDRHEELAKEVLHYANLSAQSSVKAGEIKLEIYSIEAAIKKLQPQEVNMATTVHIPENLSFNVGAPEEKPKPQENFRPATALEILRGDLQKADARLMKCLSEARDYDARIGVMTKERQDWCNMASDADAEQARLRRAINILEESQKQMAYRPKGE